MADKPISIRLPEEQLNLLKLRVNEINESIPEANVSINSICKYSSEEYLKRHYRQDVEVNLVFPFYDKIGGYIDDVIAEENNPFFDDSDKIFYSREKIMQSDEEQSERYIGKSHVEILLQAFEDIVFVLEQEQYAISTNQIAMWKQLLGRIRKYESFSKMFDEIAEKNLEK